MGHTYTSIRYDMMARLDFASATARRQKKEKKTFDYVQSGVFILGIRLTFQTSGVITSEESKD